MLVRQQWRYEQGVASPSSVELDLDEAASCQLPRNRQGLSASFVVDLLSERHLAPPQQLLGAAADSPVVVRCQRRTPLSLGLGARQLQPACISADAQQADSTGAADLQLPHAAALASACQAAAVAAKAAAALALIASRAPGCDAEEAADDVAAAAAAADAAVGRASAAAQLAAAAAADAAALAEEARQFAAARVTQEAMRQRARAACRQNVAATAGAFSRDCEEEEQQQRRQQHHHGWLHKRQEVQRRDTELREAAAWTERKHGMTHLAARQGASQRARNQPTAAYYSCISLAMRLARLQQAALAPPPRAGLEPEAQAAEWQQLRRTAAPRQRLAALAEMLQHDVAPFSMAAGTGEKALAVLLGLPWLWRSRAALEQLDAPRLLQQLEAASDQLRAEAAGAAAACDAAGQGTVGRRSSGSGSGSGSGGGSSRGSLQVPSLGGGCGRLKARLARLQLLTQCVRYTLAAPERYCQLQRAAWRHELPAGAASSGATGQPQARVVPLGGRPPLLQRLVLLLPAGAASARERELREALRSASSRCQRHLQPRARSAAGDYPSLADVLHEELAAGLCVAKRRTACLQQPQEQPQEQPPGSTALGSSSSSSSPGATPRCACSPAGAATTASAGSVDDDEEGGTRASDSSPGGGSGRAGAPPAAATGAPSLEGSPVPDAPPAAAAPGSPDAGHRGAMSRRRLQLSLHAAG